jgi:hypothetical protein
MLGHFPEKSVLLFAAILLLFLLGLRPSPRGWTEQGGPDTGATPTPTTQAG